MSRVSAAVLAIGCLLTAYGLAGSRVGATADDTVIVRRLPPSVNVGDHIRLTFTAGAFSSSPNTMECTVADLWGGWVRCAGDPSDAPSERPVSPVGGTSTQGESATWYDLMRVLVVYKPAAH
jgi:hypothetical protein